MAYDPAWDMPQINWAQQGSFESGEIPPAVEPDAGTQICIGPIAQEWLPVVLGALDQLRNPSTWIVADDAHMDTVLRRVDKLREIIAVGEGCSVPTMIRLGTDCVLQSSSDGGSTWTDVTGWADNFGPCVRSHIPPPVPYDPHPGFPDQKACNIATWLAQQVLSKAFQQRSADRTANNSVSNSVANIIDAVFGNTPFIDLLTQAANYMVQTTNPETAADVAAAATDAALQAAMIRAIFGAIRSVGYVDESNFAATASAIAAISYPAHAWAPTMLANFWTNLGLATIQQIQSEGTVTDGDCSAFDTNWCATFDFANVGALGWSVFPGGAGAPAADGFVTTNSSGDLGAVDITMPGQVGPHIIAIEVFYNVTGSTSGVHGDGFLNNDANTVTCQTSAFTAHSAGPPIVASAGPFSNVCKVPEIILIHDGWASGARLHIVRVQLHGTGVNPYGPENCI